MTSQGSSLKVIALISGGKDSFLSILQCQKLGHEIIVLANLFPPQSQNSSDEDLNSHLYQTAGHAIIPLYEQALGIPVYRREINGKASRLEREYDASYLLTNQENQRDETEDLFGLLEDILKRHPTANAVCSGAILSNYQRTRIEDVCLRLNLKSLAYLWQTSLPLPSTSDDSSLSEKASALLDYFATIGLDARIVKVASGGLDESYLWKSLLDVRVRQRIKNAMRKFGGSVVGEGGEFETLILSGPRSLFKGEIIVDEDSYHVRHGQGGEAWLDIDVSKMHVKQHDTDEVSSHMVQGHAEDMALISPISHGSSSTKVSIPVRSERFSQQLDFSNCTWESHIVRHGKLLLLNGIHSETQIEAREQEMQLIMDKISYILFKEDLTSANLIFTTIILRNMDDFEKVNTIYKTIFTKPLPPARVTVAAGNQMPPNVSILLSCTACRDIQDLRKGVHVQSISYWAPANIGPYSQAVSLPLSAGDNHAKLVFIAGQIPLVPETMLLAKYKNNAELEKFEQQATLALRHARRIGSVMDAFERAKIAYSTWKGMHEQLFIEESSNEGSEGLEGPDIWDMEYGTQRSFAAAADDHRSVPSAEALRSKQPGAKIPGFLAVHMDRLPRDANIEWQTMGFSGGSVDVRNENPYTTSCELFRNNATNFCTSTTVVVVPLMDQQDISTRYNDPARMVTIYGSAINLSNINTTNASTVPCHRVWGPVDGELVELSHGIVEQWVSDIG